VTEPAGVGLVRLPEIGNEGKGTRVVAGTIAGDELSDIV
jgi:hypothetical protein